MGQSSLPGGTRAKGSRVRPPASAAKRKSARTNGEGERERNEAAPASVAKRGRDPLLAAICHDLRAPLAAVTMGANFVLQTTLRADENARSVKILEAMLRSCSQMERLIRNFADLSELEANSLELRLGSHDAGEILDLSAETFRESAQARSVTIEVVKPKERITLRCDRERLLRALGHIVENAVKHAPEGSEVTLCVELRDADVSFVVIDRGPGLSREVRKNLYDRHWHAKRANRVGAGFGIAIARGVVAAHGGRFHFESRPDERTAFTLFTPKDGPPPDARDGEE